MGRERELERLEDLSEGVGVRKSEGVGGIRSRGRARGGSKEEQGGGRHQEERKSEGVGGTSVPPKSASIDSASRVACSSVLRERQTTGYEPFAVHAPRPGNSLGLRVEGSGFSGFGFMVPGIGVRS